MDEKFLEMAGQLSAEEVTANLARVRAEITQPKPEDFDGTCTCGEEIPKERVALKYYNCVVCQGRKEDRRRQAR
jgi:RNA polymerase-binding transcription factor DksA